MKIVIFGLSVTSSWGNGHATTFRALLRALHQRGHRVVFFEKNVEWYQNNRDLPDPDFCDLRLFDSWPDVLPSARRELADCDVAMVGSYFPDGISATDEVFNSPASVKTFYDIDTPITISALRQRGATDYLKAEQIAGFDVYFSFTGGPMLAEIEQRFGAKSAVPLYCSFDPQQYHPFKPHKRYTSDLSYMGTYATDRQPKIEVLLCEPARILPTRSFLVAGPQYPKTVKWPHNVRRITHLNPKWHPHFYSSSRFTLNVTRRDMVQAGYSPSVRLFEAAACAATIVSDNWAGLDKFFRAGREILLPASSDEVACYIEGMDDSQRKQIGLAAQARVLAEHTSTCRAEQFESAVQNARAAGHANRAAVLAS